jgi:hypothetical protein
MVALLAYFFYYVFYVSIIFSPMDFAWVYNPYAGYRDDLADNVRVYRSHTVNSLFLSSHSDSFSTRTRSTPSRTT